MEILHLVLRYTHLLGFAALTIGILIQLWSSYKVVNKLVLYGSIIQLITGFTLVGVLGSLEEDLDMVKISIKLGLVLVIVILSVVYRKKELSTVVYTIFLSLILGASLVAVFV